MSLTAVHEDTEDSSLRQVWRLTHMLLTMQGEGRQAETRERAVQPLKVHERMRLSEGFPCRARRPCAPA
jgi:hypothetical protein